MHTLSPIFKNNRSKDLDLNTNPITVSHGTIFHSFNNFRAPTMYQVDKPLSSRNSLLRNNQYAAK